jgi:hypothetical protein
MERLGILEQHADKWIPLTETGCFLWTGALSGKPLRAVVWVNEQNQNRYVARLVCEEVFGPPFSWAQAAHATANGCIGPLCVNPGHLRWATRQENMLDTHPEERSLMSSRAHVTKGNNINNLPRCITFRRSTRKKKYKVVCNHVFVGYYLTLEEAIGARDAYLNGDK